MWVNYFTHSADHIIIITFKIWNTFSRYPVFGFKGLRSASTLWAKKWTNYWRNSFVYASISSAVLWTFEWFLVRDQPEKRETSTRKSLLHYYHNTNALVNIQSVPRETYFCWRYAFKARTNIKSAIDHRDLVVTRNSWGRWPHKRKNNYFPDNLTFLFTTSAYNPSCPTP